MKLRVSGLAHNLGIIIMILSISVGSAAFYVGGTANMLDYFPDGSARAIDNSARYFVYGLGLATLGEIGIAVGEKG